MFSYVYRNGLIRETKFYSEQNIITMRYYKQKNNKTSLYLEFIHLTKIIINVFSPKPKPFMVNKAWKDPCLQTLSVRR